MYASSLAVRLIACVLALSASVAPSFAQAANAFAGVWELDLFKSVYEPEEAAPRKRTMTLEGTGNQIKITTRTFRDSPNNGGMVAANASYAAGFDGKEYPTGAEGATVQLKRIDANTVERTARLKGSVAETAKWVVSADGKTMTITAKGIDATGAAYSSTQIYTKTS